MNTFILKWNPEASPYSLIDFQRDFPQLEYGNFRWVLDEASGLRSGDNFFLVKTGKGSCGIVMKGFFISEPYSIKKDGTSGYMVDLRPTYMFHPDHPKGILPLNELKAGIPDFPWEGEASGIMLSRRQCDILSLMWGRFLEGYDNSDYDGILADRNRRPSAGVDDAVSLVSEVLYDKKDSAGDPLILRALRSGLSGETVEDKIRGFLHDVISTPDWDAGALRDRGFSEDVIDGLLLKTA